MPRGRAFFPKTMGSLPIYSNNEAITKARLTYTGSLDSVRLELGLSATYGGTYTYEEVENGVDYEFTGSGLWVKWRITGVNGTISKIEVQIL